MFLKISKIIYYFIRKPTMNLIRMNYKTQILLDWIREHPLISVMALEKQAGVPSCTVKHALSKTEQRDLPEKHYDAIVAVLFDYGFRE